MSVHFFISGGKLLGWNGVPDISTDLSIIPTQRKLNRGVKGTERTIRYFHTSLRHSEEFLLERQLAATQRGPQKSNFLGIVNIKTNKTYQMFKLRHFTVL